MLTLLGIDRFSFSLPWEPAVGSSLPAIGLALFCLVSQLYIFGVLTNKNILALGLTLSWTLTFLGDRALTLSLFFWPGGLPSATLAFLLQACQFSAGRRD